VVIALVLIAAAFFRGRIALRRVELVYWQHRCTRYAATQQPVLDTRLPRATLHPKDLEGFAGTMNQLPIIYRVPAAWEHLSALLPPGGPASVYSKGTVFVGLRKSAAGNQRLVAVDLVPYLASPCVMITPRVIRPGSLLNEPAECPPPRQHSHFVEIRSGCVFFAAQPDATDESRFSFRFEVEGGSFFTVKGRLMDNDTVSLETIREPAATPPAPASPGLSR
jgi:hypothetical protein